MNPFPSSLYGVASGFEAFALKALHETLPQGPLLYVVKEEESLDLLANQLSCLTNDPIVSFPGWDCLPYDYLSPSRPVLSARIVALSQQKKSPLQRGYVLTSLNGLLQYVPPLSLLPETIELLRGSDFPREMLLSQLVGQGYRRAETVYESGEFAVRGSLVDIFPPGAPFPLRLDFFGDEIENMRFFDPFSQKSLSTEEATSPQQCLLPPISEVVLTESTIKEFRSRYRELFGTTQDTLYTSLSAGKTLKGMEQWLPLFYPSLRTLEEIFTPSHIILEDGLEGAAKGRLELIESYYHLRTSSQEASHRAPKGSFKDSSKESWGKALPPSELYWSKEKLQNFCAQESVSELTSRASPEQGNNHSNFQTRLRPDLPSLCRQQFPQMGFLDALGATLNHFVSHKKEGKTVILTALTKGSQDRLVKLLNDHGVTSIQVQDTWPVLSPSASPSLFCVVFPLEQGFETPTTLVFSEKDLLGERLSRPSLSRSRQSDAFFLEAAALSPGDLVVHREHGVGQYQELVTLTVEGIPHDCLRLHYAGDDKLFVPVENLDTLTRYSSDTGAAPLDKLGSTAWQNRKARVKKRLLEIADSLMSLAAQRHLASAETLDSHNPAYDAFCATFPYVETEDQKRAIEEVQYDLNQSKPMDRLICGDVGFGKTEVALRAAFIAVSQGKQVAVVVPTTLLCRQHLETFQKRFPNHRIGSLSRLTKPKEGLALKTLLAQGEIDIIIATHALFSNSVQFHDLGLLIIDEEQHFGVQQKEKLKQLKNNVHVLTLSATPIPRTLQLALSGVKEMSLMTTPPLGRLAVRTFVAPLDDIMLTEALLREHNRGGQIFAVCPRIEDLEPFKEKLQKLAPTLRMGVAHSQLAPATLEEIIHDFYEHRLDLLLSTNIIDSGIDVSNANTLVVNRSHLFGLAQLYQLRGRVGRSKTQGYAYLTYDPQEKVSELAFKRLEILQSLDSLGSGFALSHHDLDLRGAGNIVGAEQSGQVREVGIELYQHLLEEAIALKRAEAATKGSNGLGEEMTAAPDTDWSPQIHLGIAVLIPETYVVDLNLRLGLYRRIATLQSRTALDSFSAELIDRFGKIPQELQNLLELVEIKGICKRAGIEKIEAGPQSVMISFYQNRFKKPEKLLEYLQAHNIRVRPDHKLVFGLSSHAPKTRLAILRKICRSLEEMSKG